MLSCPIETYTVHSLRCRAMPSEFEHMTWYMLREKYRNPQRPYKQEIETSNIDAEYIAFQERRRQAMLSMSTVLVLLQRYCSGRLYAWFFELLGAGPSDWCKPIETTSISIVLLHRRRPQHGLTPNCTKLDDLHINCAMQVIAREMDPQHRLLGRLGDDSQ